MINTFYLYPHMLGLLAVKSACFLCVSPPWTINSLRAGPRFFIAFSPGLAQNKHIKKMLQFRS